MLRQRRRPRRRQLDRQRAALLQRDDAERELHHQRRHHRVKDWLGHLYVEAQPSTSPTTGDIDWSGTASVTSRDWTQQSIPTADVAQPKPMWMGRVLVAHRDYDDEYGNDWVPGNSSTSVEFDSTTPPPSCARCCARRRRHGLPATSPTARGTKPMVYFFMCDNNGIYPQVCRVRGHRDVLRPHGDQRVDHRLHRTASTTHADRRGRRVRRAAPTTRPTPRACRRATSSSERLLHRLQPGVVGAIATSSLKTTTMVTQTVPGSWQQLPAN